MLGLLVIPIPKPPSGPGIFDSEKTHDGVWLKNFSACDTERKKGKKNQISSRAEWLLSDD